MGEGPDIVWRLENPPTMSQALNAKHLAQMWVTLMRTAAKEISRLRERAEEIAELRQEVQASSHLSDLVEGLRDEQSKALKSVQNVIESLQLENERLRQEAVIAKEKVKQYERDAELRLLSQKSAYKNC